MTVYTLEPEELTRLANDIKEVLLHKLEAMGEVRDAAGLCERVAVVIHRKNILGRLIEKVKGTADDYARITVVKVL